MSIHSFHDRTVKTPLNPVSPAMIPPKSKALAVMRVVGPRETTSFYCDSMALGDDAADHRMEHNAARLKTLNPKTVDPIGTCTRSKPTSLNTLLRLSRKVYTYPEMKCLTACDTR